MVENTNGGGKQPPRKSFLYYYGLVMLIVMLLNIFLFPSMMDRTQQVRFDQFSDQLKEDNVDEVYVTTNNEIVYTLKNDNKNTAWNVTYKTGEIPGVNLYDLLDGKDVKYSAEINTQASPLLNFLLTWILPLILFVGIGQFMGRSLMKRMGGGPGNDVWQVECEDLCRIRDGYHICRCGWRGRGEGCIKRDCRFPA